MRNRWAALGILPLAIATGFVSHIEDRRERLNRAIEPPQMHLRTLVLGIMHGSTFMITSRVF
jgi:hypothetical protein